MSVRATTPPILQGPTAKEKKYDRQLRLWAAAGQKALEDAHVLLINNGPGVVGVETLKNLVLPGIGNFTIVDAGIVTEEDLGINFFLDANSLGKSRAHETRRFLQELNPEVNGQAVQQEPEVYMKGRTFEANTLILLVLPSPLLGDSSSPTDLASVTKDLGIPIFFVYSIGFYSMFTLQLPSRFPIVDTHPDPTSLQDLRLLNPWPELVDFTRVKTADLSNLSDHEHGHIPYLLLLLHHLEDWKGRNDGKAPGTYAEKTRFRDTVSQAMRRDNPEGGEENYEEAVAAVLKNLNPSSISSGLQEVFDSEELRSRAQGSASFWIVAHAIHTFHARHGVLPLPGSLPDMKAQSADYVQLQNIYRAKAKKDLAEVSSLVRQRESEVGITGGDAAPEAEIETFCKGAAYVKLIRGEVRRTDEMTKEQAVRIAQGLEPPDEFTFEDSLVPIWLGVKAYGRLVESEGGKNDSLHVNVDSLKSHAEVFLQDIKTGLRQYETDATLEVDSAMEIVVPILQEIARSGGTELHNIAALTGGMVAQEVIKVITKQYVPIENVCIFDGVKSKSQVLRLPI
ncbi:hypothetical protein MMC25_005505 [Agyrium rufum]|nr:hypothetical protein [Agyrium rufum]